MKRKRSIVIDALNKAKVVLTNSNLDPLEKGYILTRLNKVIKNKNSHFITPNVGEGFALLFDWGKNIDPNMKDNYNFWSYLGLYLIEGGDYCEEIVKKCIAEAIN